MSDKYVAYVSTYTYGDDYGIRVYDVDLEQGKLTEKRDIRLRMTEHWNSLVRHP